MKAGELVETITTGKDGTAISKKLYLGTYTVQEIKQPGGYLLGKDLFEIPLTHQDQNTEIVLVEKNVKNTPTKVVLTKKELGSEKLLAGVTFKLWNKEDETQKGSTYVTGEDGTLVITHLLPGTYCLQEVSTIPGYIVSDQIYEFTIAADGRVNKETVGTVEAQNDFTKIDLSKHDLTTGKEIEGGTYQLLDQDEHVLDEWTGTKKPHRMKKLVVGQTYIFREILAPEGYLIAQDVLFTIESTGKVQKVEMFDELAMGTITIQKSDAETKNPITGAVFQVYAAEDIVTPDGTVRVEKDTLVDTIATDCGTGTTKPLFLGKYQVVETQAAPGYIKSEKTLDVELKYKDQNTSLVNQTVQVTNKPTTIEIEKMGKDTKKPLKGVTFHIWNKEEGKAKAKTFVTDQKGKITVKNLIPGTYQIQEVETASGYVVSDKIYEITIDQEGKINGKETGNVIVENDFTKIDFTKHDLTTGKEIEGGKYQVLDQDGTVVDEWIGTKKPHRLNKLVAGQTYIFREILAPEGYLLAQDVTFTVDPTGDVQKVQMFDELAMGTITVEKTDAETKEQITGALFKVYAAEDIVTPDGTVRVKEGTLVDRITTEQGKATTKPLFLGKYRVREQKAAPGYVKDPKDDYVTLKYQDQNTRIVTETIGVKNRPTTIVVEKICNETKQPLAGVQFAIWNKSAKEETMQVRTTDENGKITWKHVLPGTYCIQEMKSAEGYLLDSKIHEVIVDEDGRIDRKEIGTLILQNEFTRVDLSKHDISTGKEIKGGTYQVLDQEGHVLDEWIGTGTPHRMEKLIVGKTYIFREIIAPEGYLLAQDVSFTIEQTKEVQKVEMYDELAMGRIQVKKTDGGTKEPVTGAFFKVYASEDIVTPDGTLRVKKDELVDVIQTEEGIAQTQKLFLGTYRVVESQPAPGYAKDDQEHLIELKYQDQNTALVLETMEVENKPTTLIVEKVRKGTKVVLEGVAFKVWNKSDETKTAIEYVTDETGRFMLNYLIPGVYCIQEVKPKEGYLLNKTIYEVVVNEDGHIILEEGREPKEQAVLTIENALEVKIETPEPTVKTGDHLPGPFWGTIALMNLSILMLIARNSLFSFGRKGSILNHRRKQKREGDV